MSNLIFFGSDQYSAVALATLLEHRTTKVLDHISVVTDQHAGGSQVEILANKHDVKVSYYPDFDHSLITKDTLGLCASFDHLIPAGLIAKFAGNLYNLHPSLLPQYRNVSPVQYAILMGDKETGITLFRISPGIDDGEIISQATGTITESDTTSTLTPRLFATGAQLFLDYVKNDFSATGKLEERKTGDLIFTKRLKKDSGYIEWIALKNLLAGKPIVQSDTKNELLALRLTHHPAGNILSDLLRALSPWPGIWSLVPSKKGDLRVSLESISPVMLKIAGKPKAISLADFEKYYL